jgi:hypothetical protein
VFFFFSFLVLFSYFYIFLPQAIVKECIMGLDNNSSNVNLIVIDSNVPWAYSAIRPKFFFLDAYSIFPIGLWFLHWSDLTFGIALVCVFFLVITERLGLPLPLMWIYLRARLVGNLRPQGDLALYRKRCRF